MMQINPQCGEHQNCEHLSRTLGFSVEFFFHQFSVLAGKILIILLDYILLLEILWIKCWQQAGILLPLWKWVRVILGKHQVPLGTRSETSTELFQDWTPFSGILRKKKQRHIPETYSSFQNLGLIISNDAHCKFTSLFARTCTKVKSKVVFLRKGLLRLSPAFNSCRSECKMRQL